MRAIDFIEADVKRVEKGAVRAVAIGLSLGVLSVGLGLWAREDFREVFTLQNLLPPALMLIGLTAGLAVYLQKAPWARKLVWLCVILVGVLALSLVQPQTEVSLSKFQDPARFWPENLHCLLVGAGVSLVTSILLSVLMLRFLPSPNRRWQTVLSFLPGVCGLVALTVHCMGALVSHTLIAHWGQVLLIFPFAYAQQRVLFKIQMKKALSGHLGSLKNVGDLG